MNCTDRIKLEDDHTALLFTSIRAIHIMKAGACHFTEVLYAPFAGVFKHVQLLAIFHVVTDSSIATYESHISMLTLTSVEEAAIDSPSILVSMLFSRLTSKNKDYLMLGRSADAALLLTAKDTMQLRPAVHMS